LGKNQVFFVFKTLFGVLIYPGAEDTGRGHAQIDLVYFCAKSTQRYP
jgi:Zn-dependent M28 family amino/carboxypeptidase